MPDRRPLFALGCIFSTPGALEALDVARVDGRSLLARHVTGDWAEMDEVDQQANRLALEDGSRIFSSYRLPTGVKVWVITEADCSATTLLLPDEY